MQSLVAVLRASLLKYNMKLVTGGDKFKKLLRKWSNKRLSVHVTEFTLM